MTTETLREIMKALQESEATQNAVGRSLTREAKPSQRTLFKGIAELANTGEESDTDEASSPSLYRKQGAERAKVIQRLRTDTRTCWMRGFSGNTPRALKLFQSVEASPVFKDARIED